MKKQTRTQHAPHAHEYTQDRCAVCYAEQLKIHEQKCMQMEGGGSACKWKHLDSKMWRGCGHKGCGYQPHYQTCMQEMVRGRHDFFARVGGRHLLQDAERLLSQRLLASAHRQQDLHVSNSLRVGRPSWLTQRDSTELSIVDPKSDLNRCRVYTSVLSSTSVS